VLAYVVNVSWNARRLRSARAKSAGAYLGFNVGAGFAGFVGIVVALLTAEHRAAGYANLLDVIGTSWAAVSLLILGLTTTAEPLIAYMARSPRRSN
jgi:hypothetical protein